MSAIGYAESQDGIHFTRFDEPLIMADQPYESRLGCEDARIAQVDSRFILFYTAVGGVGDKQKVRIAAASSTDFKNWEKHGIVGPQFATSKAAVLLPEKINDQFVLLYTWRADSPMSSIMQIRFKQIEDILNPQSNLFANNIDHYEENVIVPPPQPVFRGAEVGAQPIKTKAGCLYIAVRIPLLSRNGQSMQCYLTQMQPM